MVRYTEHLPLIKVQTQRNKERNGRNMEKHFNWMHKFLIRLQLNDNEWKENIFFSNQYTYPLPFQTNNEYVWMTPKRKLKCWVWWLWGWTRNILQSLPCLPRQTTVLTLIFSSHPFPIYTAPFTLLRIRDKTISTINFHLKLVFIISCYTITFIFTFHHPLKHPQCDVKLMIGFGCRTVLYICIRWRTTKETKGIKGKLYLFETHTVSIIMFHTLGKTYFPLFLLFIFLNFTVFGPGPGTCDTSLLFQLPSNCMRLKTYHNEDVMAYATLFSLSLCM